MLYILKIINQFTKKETEYLVKGGIDKLTTAINTHYGLPLVTNNTTGNLISRQSVTSKKYKNITIYKIKRNNCDPNTPLKKKPIYQKKIPPLPLAYSINS